MMLIRAYRNNKLKFRTSFYRKMPMDLESNKIFKGKIITPKLLGGHPIGNIELKAQGKRR